MLWFHLKLCISFFFQKPCVHKFPPYIYSIFHFKIQNKSSSLFHSPSFISCCGITSSSSSIISVSSSSSPPHFLFVMTGTTTFFSSVSSSLVTRSNLTAPTFLALPAKIYAPDCKHILRIPMLITTKECNNVNTIIYYKLYTTIPLFEILGSCLFLFDVGDRHHPRYTRHQLLPSQAPLLCFHLFSGCIQTLHTQTPTPFRIDDPGIHRFDEKIINQN
ncbi:hypothetical protein Hanom_Chr11g00999161 [Helianthus anomalus]